MIKRNLRRYILIFRLALALNKHELKMPVLANTRFGPQFSISQNFAFVSNITAAYLVFRVTHSSYDVLFQMVACFYTVEQCATINNLSITSATRFYCKSGVCNLKLCVTLGSR